MIKMKELLLENKNIINESSDVDGFNQITQRLQRECGTNDLMFGHCQTWADEIVKRYPEYEKVETSLWSARNKKNKTPCHVFLYKNGLFYDADKPSGVKDPRSLPFFGGYKGAIDFHKQGKDKADTIHYSYDSMSNNIINEDRSSKSVSLGCLMCYVCEEDSKKLNELNDLLIPEDILYKKDGEFGREGECHITAKYGFTTDLTKEEIVKLTSELNMFEVNLKRISMFKNKKDGFDVVKFDVDSDIINELNKKACEFPNEDSHPNFHAHLTLAYVKPDSFKKEKKNLNIKVKIDEIVYSPIEGEKIHLKLTNKKEKLDEGNHLDFLNTEIPRLEKEWERLDSMGGRENEQAAISKLLQQYRRDKLKWDNLYKATMKETIYAGYEVELRNENKYVEVFINPSSRELKECMEHDQYAVLLTDTDAYTWNRMAAYHGQIRAKDQKFRNAVSLDVYPEGNLNICSVMVTDNNRNTSWNENPKIEKFIRNHPFFKNKTLKDVYYWNQDIVGDWAALKEDFGTHDLVYGGVFHDGRIVAFVATDLQHNHTRDMGRNRWIYDESKKCVYWHIFPLDNEDKHAVENYLHRMGYVVNYHRNMKTYYEPILSMNENIINEGVKETSAIEFMKNSIKGSQFENHVFLAGGIVRDEILGIEPHDIDVVVDIKDGGILFLTWLAKKHGIYKEQSSPVIFPTFGTAKLSLDGINYAGVDLSGIDIEAVMTRGETYSDGSRKPEVHYDDLKTDTLRRDSTVNSLLKNVSTGEILDLTGQGISDIKNGILRTPLDPDITFSDDPLRMMRFIRQSNKFGWKIADDALEGIKRNASKLPNISNERIKDELTKILTSDTPVRGIRLLKDTGLLKYIIPEFEEAYEMTQNKYHDKSVWEHTLDVVSKTPPDLITRLQSLFHDLGKVKTRTVVDDNIHFFGHENFSSDMARQVLERLKFPNNIIDAVCIGVKNHMRLKRSGENGEIASDKSLRKFVVDLGDHLESTLTLMAADNSVHRGEYTNPNQIPGIRARIEKLKNTIPAKNSKLPVTGEDLKALKIPAGPIYKEILDTIRDAIYENPNLTRDEAFTIVQNVLKNK